MPRPSLDCEYSPDALVLVQFYDGVVAMDICNCCIQIKLGKWQRIIIENNANIEKRRL